MNKIIQVINKMIDERDRINVMLKLGTDSSPMFLFYYKEYAWVIYYENDGYFLGFLGSTYEISEDLYKSIIPLMKIAYTSNQFKGQEALESFKELYQIVLEKSIGFDDVLDNLLKE